MDSPFVRVTEDSPHRVDGYAALGLGLYRGRIICPTCHSAANVEGYYTNDNRRKKGETTWICSQCDQNDKPCIFHTAPQSHFICCPTVLVCSRCNGRGWVRQ